MAASQQILLGAVSKSGDPNGGRTFPTDAALITQVIDSNVDISTSSIGVYPDGSLICQGNQVINSPFWASPVEAGIGKYYWTRLMINSGSAPTGNAINVPISLNLTAGNAVNWSLRTDVFGGPSELTCNATLQIASDAGFSTIKSSATFTFASTATTSGTGLIAP